MVYYVKIRASDKAILWVRTSGTVTDMYDWDFSHDPPQAGFQAGFGTLSLFGVTYCGHIYASEVLLNNTVYDYPYTAP